MQTAKIGDQEYEILDIKQDYVSNTHTYTLKPLVPKRVSREWPIDGDEYWYIYFNDYIALDSSRFDEMHMGDIERLKIGNCFRSRETADKVVEAIREVLELLRTDNSHWSDFEEGRHRAWNVFATAREAVQADKESV